MKKIMRVELRKRKLKDGKQSFYLAWWDPNAKHIVTSGDKEGQEVTGTWKYEFLGLYLEKNQKVRNDETMRDAEEIRSKKFLELKNGITIEDKEKASFLKYFKGLAFERSKPRNRTWFNALAYLEKFIRENGYNLNIDFSEVTPDFVKQFRDFLLDQSSLQKNTARGYYVKFKACLNQGIRDGILEKSPARNIKPIKELETKFDYLTFEEIEKLSNTYCGDEEVKKVFLFCCYSGIRKGDAFNLKWDDFKKNIINGDVQYQLCIRQEKTEEPIWVPLHPFAEEIIDIKKIDLEKMRGQRVFCKLKNYSQIDRELKIWVARAGINRRVYFHMSRHSFAMLNYLRSTDLPTIQKLLGHKSIKSTGIYARVPDQKMIEAINKILKPNLSRAGKK